MEKEEKIENIKSIIQNLEMVKRDVANLREMDDKGCDELFDAWLAVPTQNFEVWHQMLNKVTFESGLRHATDELDCAIGNLSTILKHHNRYSEEA